jgi:hypothetical protein
MLLVGWITWGDMIRGLPGTIPCPGEYAVAAWQVVPGPAPPLGVPGCTSGAPQGACVLDGYRGLSIMCTWARRMEALAWTGDMGIAPMLIWGALTGPLGELLPWVGVLEAIP